MKILWVLNRFPWPKSQGRWLRVYHLSRCWVEAGEEVAVLSRQKDPEGIEAYEKIGVKSLPNDLDGIVNSGRGRCWSAPHFFDEELAREIQGRSGQFDCALLGGSPLLQYAPEAGAAGKVVAEMVDDPVLEERRKLWKQLGWHPFSRRLKYLLTARNYERRYLGPVAFSSFVSQEDCRSFQSRHKGHRTVFAPNGVEVEYFARPGDYERSEGPGRIVFHGHLANPNNVYAVRELLGSIAPIVHRSRPEVRLDIVGGGASDQLLAMAGGNVNFTGFVPDIREPLWDADVALLPMQTGTGIKNKLLEAWAAGVAVVATPLACQGIPVEEGVNALVGRDASELASAALRLLDDESLRESIARGGLETARSRMSWRQVADNFLRELRS